MSASGGILAVGAGGVAQAAARSARQAIASARDRGGAGTGESGIASSISDGPPPIAGRRPHGRRPRVGRRAYPCLLISAEPTVGWIFLEIVLALAIAAGIVWWTLPRKPKAKPGARPPGEPDDPPGP